MNFLGAFLLLISGGNEDEAFVMLIEMFKHFHLLGIYEEKFPVFDILSFIFEKSL